MLELAVKHQALDGIVGAGSRLFGQLLHADELFIDDGQRPVGDLYHGDGVAGIAAPLSQGGDVRAHHLAPARGPPADGGGHKGDAGQDSVNASI